MKKVETHEKIRKTVKTLKKQKNIIIIKMKSCEKNEKIRKTMKKSKNYENIERKKNQQT